MEGHFFRGDCQLDKIFVDSLGRRKNKDSSLKHASGLCNIMLFQHRIENLLGGVFTSMFELHYVIDMHIQP